jgi:hypothetical protein
MAKRKRLTPAQAGFGDAAPVTQSRSPIAHVVGDAAVAATLDELSTTLQTARQNGRLVLELPLDSVIDDYLVRDRIVVDAAAQEALTKSLRARGQQTPIEVTALPGSERYGLISGWRRLTALRALAEETGRAEFETVLALLRPPADLAQSYIAMVEENEIRAALSFFERARIVARSLDAGVFETEKAALQSLFSAASYAQRSKIKSFLPIVAALDGVLLFPTYLTERAGLALSKALLGQPRQRPNRPVSHP